MSEKKIRGAVIGYGGAFNMGKNHLDWMSKAGIVPTAACDIDPTRVKAAETDFPGIRTYSKIEDLLADDEVDIIAIITPHNTHAALAIGALNAGKGVIVEKPMCLTAAEATAMIDAAKRNKVLLTVFHNRRHDGDFMMLKETILEKGLIGNIFSIQAGFSGYRHPGHWWRSDKKISGGTLYDWGAHFIDWILNLLPGQKVVSVNGYFHKLVWDDVTNEDHTQAIIRFDSGAHADLTISNIGSLPMPRLRIQGTKGGILDDGSVKDGMQLFRSVDGVMMKGELRNKPSNWDQYYKDVYAHLVDDALLSVTPESARRIIAIIEAAEKSAKSGLAEPVPYE